MKQLYDNAYQAEQRTTASPPRLPWLAEEIPRASEQQHRAKLFSREHASLRAVLARLYRMAQSPPSQAQTWLLHAVIWGLLAVLLFTQPGGRVPTNQFYLLQSLFFAVLLGVFYLNVYWAVPRLLYRRRWLAYFGFLAAVLVGVVLPHRQLQRYLETRYGTTEPAYPPDRWPRSFRPPLETAQLPGPPPDLAMMRGRGVPGSPHGPKWFEPAMLLATLLVVGLGTSVAAIQRGQHDAQVRGALEQEKLATELSLLKAQINPHFFFNTLNNIYSLTLLDVERARAALHRLSRMMRYVLYETPNGQTRLSQEINFLLDYVELMNLRLTDQVEVVVETPSPPAGAPAADPLIAPMLFQPFLENAFKHGVSALVSSRIAIALRQPGAQQVELCVRNTLVPPAATYTDEPGGIGLANTRRRLDLLYPGRYQLRITNPTPANEYEVCLSLHLHP